MRKKIAKKIRWKNLDFCHEKTSKNHLLGWLVFYRLGWVEFCRHQKFKYFSKSTFWTTKVGLFNTEFVSRNYLECLDTFRLSRRIFWHFLATIRRHCIWQWRISILASKYTPLIHLRNPVRLHKLGPITDISHSVENHFKKSHITII